MAHSQYTADMVKAEVDYEAALEELRQYDGMSSARKEDPFQRALWCAAEWLHAKLVDEHEATPTDVHDSCFAFGQCVAMDSRDPYEVAARFYTRWLEGERLRPGAKLGTELLTKGAPQ